MTKQFRVHVERADGSQGIEIRRVVNFPEMPADREEAFLRAEWAKYYAGETYHSIDPVGADEPPPRPTPGMFPSGMNL